MSTIITTIILQQIRLSRTLFLVVGKLPIMKFSLNPKMKYWGMFRKSKWNTIYRQRADVPIGNIWGMTTVPGGWITRWQTAEESGWSKLISAVWICRMQIRSLSTMVCMCSSAMLVINWWTSWGIIICSKIFNMMELIVAKLTYVGLFFVFAVNLVCLDGILLSPPWINPCAVWSRMHVA